MTHHTDKHLNMFHPYGGNEYIENNITKAFINTLEALTESKQYSAIYNLFGLDLSEIPEQDIKFNYYLQQKPNYLIDRFPERNRLLLAISPTGKAWQSSNLQDMSNTKKNINETVMQISKEIEIDDIDNESIEKSKEDEIQAIRDILSGRGNSIPDAWILIYLKNEPYYVIIIENKLYDLNPFQLLNHKQKSLNLQLTEFTDLMKDKNITFIKYEDIYNCLHENYNYNFIVRHFLEFLDNAGYGALTPFTQDDLTAFEEYKNDKDTRQCAIIRYKLIRHIYEVVDELLLKGINKFDRKTMRVWKNENEKFNIYIDVSKTTLNVDISTEIGVKKKYVNQEFLPKLKNNLNFQNKVIQAYNSKVYYVRYIRLNKAQQTLYFWITEYTTLKDYLDIINLQEIYQKSVDKEKCIELLSKLGKTEADKNMEKLCRYSHTDYNKLEYLRIINTINVEELLNDENNLRETISNIIQNHLEGIDVLENIYFEPKTV